MKNHLMSASVLALTFCLVACGATNTSEPKAATATRSTASASSSAGPAGLRMVVLGDSIPYNSPEDCPGCTGFVDRFAKLVGRQHHKPVEVLNDSQHNGLTLEMLLDEMDLYSVDLAAADVIVVGIAHNSNELASETPCGKPVDKNENPEWSAMTMQCARASAAKYRPMYDKLFGTVSGLRKGKPTLLRTINRYNDWTGYPGGHYTPDENRTIAMFIRIWDSMLCASAKEHGFGCADLSTAFNGPDGLRPSGNLVGADYTHPSERGNRVIAHVLASLGTRLTRVP